MGDTGTGKTTLGMLAAKEALAAGKTVAVYFAPKLLTQIRQTYQATDSEDAYDAFFKRLTSVDLLYIDDLGSERHTDWVVEQLYALINERYENQRSMLVTSNAAGDVDKGQRLLEEQIGARSVSRLVEICGDPLPLFGPDQRVEPSAAGS
jgi:DNA replication protein DnaC